MVNRVGKFNYDTNTHSLPKKKINAFLEWNHLDYEINLNARHIDGYKNQRPVTGLGLSYGYKTVPALWAGTVHIAANIARPIRGFRVFCKKPYRRRLDHGSNV